MNPNEEKTYDTADAATYLGCSISKIKYHLYKTGKLEADGTHGAALYFNKDTLDKFRGKPIKRGRPKGAKNKVQFDA